MSSSYEAADWQQCSSVYGHVLSDSLTTARIPLLSRIQTLVATKSVPDDDLKELLIKLLHTYNYYQDANSRNALTNTLAAIVTYKQSYTEAIFKFVHLTVAAKASTTLALTDYLTLLSWLNRFMVLAIDKETVLSIAVEAHAVIVSQCASYCADSSANHHRRVYDSVISSSTTALVSVIQAATDVKTLLNNMITNLVKTTAIPLDAIVSYLGIISRATIHLLAVNPAASEYFRAESMPTILNYYTTTILLGKNLPAVYALDIFGHIVTEYITTDNLSTTIIPAVERAILRSSESSFTILLPPLFSHTSSDIELSNILLSSKLLGSIISALKSPKDNVRHAAFNTLQVILKDQFLHSSVTDVHKYTEEILKALKGTTNLEAKHIISKAISLVGISSDEVSIDLLTQLLPVVAKEQNEVSLTHLIGPFLSHLVNLAHTSTQWNTSEFTPFITQLKTGLQDKKLPLKKIWFTELGHAVVHHPSNSEGFQYILTEITPILVAALEEAIAAPFPTVSNKSIIIPLVIITILAQFKVDSLPNVISSNDEKPSILMDSRIYLKLSTEAEYEWQLHALVALSSTIVNAPEPHKLAYASAWVFVLISNHIPSAIRLDARKQLASVLVITPELSLSLIDGIYSVIQHYDTKSMTDTDKDHWSLSIKDLSPVLSIFTTIKDHNDTVTANLIAVFIISHATSINGGWVGLVQRSGLSIDPGYLIETHNEQLLTQAFTNLKESTSHGILGQACVKAVDTLAFIKPDLVAPRLTQYLATNLSDTYLSTIDEEAIAIWKGIDGELVVDVLDASKSTKKQEDKNSKDYELKKWEESIKNELAAKNKAAKSKRLTKEEQHLVDEQLGKERTIRHEMSTYVEGVVGALAIIRSLIKSAIHVENGAHTWFTTASSSVLTLLVTPYQEQLFGDQLVGAFINFSAILSSRLGNLKPFVAVSILRLHNVVGIPPNYIEEPLINLVGRILYRIKILSDQSPLDSLTLSYCLPLITKVLQHGKQVAIKNAEKQVVTSEFVEEDPEEEQLLLAVEIISAHAEAFEDESIPRLNILEVLISLMKLPSKAKLAKDCFLAMCQHIALSYTEADLELVFSNIITPEVFVRNSILEGIDAEFDLTGQSTFSSEIWIATFDNDEHSRELAVTIWDDNNFQVVEDATTHLLPFFGNKNAGLRFSIARAFAAAVEVLIPQVPTILERAIEQLIDLYHVKENPPPPKLDRFGLPIKSTMDNKDTWEERSTIALTLGFLAPLLSSKNIERVFEFLVSERALGDKEPLVRQELQDSGKEIINLHGKENVEVLIPIFEVNLAAKDERSKTQNNIKESVIILYGSLARHLDIKDDRLEIIVDRLLKTLDTPSISVQYAIAECIAPLVKSFESKVPQQLDLLFTKLFEGKTLPIRKGAAYGIAGLVKGYGIKALRTFDIIRTLSDAADDKKDPHRREGVSYAFECFSRCLGRFFEPYVIEILPILLKSLGDPVPEVRDATNEAAKQIMKTTTSFGVKKLIPLAISNLDEIAWRSKKGSVELLGSMAYLDPTQLSASLSTIVPEIVGVLNDTHKEVRKAGEQSLKRFGEVIRNPEIQAIVPDLINAIGDPTKYTDDALDKLIKTQFVHYIDGPSLALIIHVIHRGMKERSAATKKKACQIVGNMSILVDSKDLKPYLTELVQELEVSMVDPVPATRSTAARALGSLVEKLGEDQFPDLIPHLLDTLQDETKLGDRLGSAQALSEVISGLGINKLEELLPIILSSASSPRNHIRAGFMPLLLFLPVCFGTQFSPYLTKIIPPILNGLADIDEDIRDTALRAGRLIVKNYAKKAVDILLPELENGLSDSNYRIRLSSVELTGDLLFQITGISGKNELTEEQNEFSGEVNRNLLEVLGQERRDRVLSLLFVCRSDVAGIVRNASVDIWKALVANTPKTVKEVLPTLTTIIVKKLASDDDVQRTIGAQTLGEMVRRVGANALAQILPTLEETLASGDTDSKQGICIAVTELIKSAQRDALVEYQDEFITIVRDSLIDSSNGVREAAARAFEALQEALGKVVIDEIIPHLLSLLERPDSDSQNALLALQDIMETKADIVFPILLPSLLTAPIDTFKANALASLASVAGSALYKRLSIIINTLVNAMVEFIDNEAIPEAFDKILLAIDEEEGVHPLMQQLLSLVKHEDAAKRAVVYGRLGNFFTNTTIDYSIYLQDMVSQFILSLDDKTPAVVKGTFDALSALVKSQSKESLEKLVKPARQALELTGVKGEPLAAFALPKGPNCILPIFLHGLMYGTSDQREASALAIADIIDKTPADNLKPFATTMTGPLIRVVGEKVSSDIKAAILVALNSLLIKIPQFLRPFIPQLQRTFVRSLSDSANEKLRSQAVKALSTLIEFQPRVDSLVTELVSGAKSSGDSGVKTSMLKAMLEVVVKAGKNMNATSKTAIMTLVEDEITIVDDKSAVSYAKLVGSLAKILNLEEAKHILKNKILDKPNNTNDKFSILSVNSFLRYSPEHIFNAGLLDEIVEFIVASSNSSQSYISDNATVAMGKLLLLHDEVESPVSKAVSDTTDSLPKFTISDEQAQLLVTQLATTTLSPLSNSTDTRRLSLVVIRTVARFKYQQFISPYLDVLVPSVFSCLRDPVIPIKLAAEKAYLAVFDLVDDSESKVFNGWFEGKQEFVTVTGTSIVARSIGDYTRRVASRLAGVERERIVAGGDAETMFSDRYEDEAEVWAIGGV